MKSFNQIMTDIDNAPSKDIFEICCRELSDNRKSYTLSQLWFAEEFITERRKAWNNLITSVEYKK